MKNKRPAVADLLQVAVTISAASTPPRHPQASQRNAEQQQRTRLGHHEFCGNVVLKTVALIGIRDRAHEAIQRPVRVTRAAVRVEQSLRTATDVSRPA